MRLETYARKKRVKISRHPTTFEVDQLRFAARSAWLDGREARSAALYAVAAKMQRHLDEEHTLQRFACNSTT